MNILVISEDPHYDQHILKPLLRRLFRSIGKPTAKIGIPPGRTPRGVRDALRSETLARIVERYRGETDIFVLCVDRDGELGRRQRLDQIEAEFGSRCVFLAQEAWEEIEAWVLAGLDLPPDWRWRDVRAEIHVKERYFDVLARERGVAGGLGGGRKALAEEAAANLSAIRLKCPQDFDALAQRIETAAASAA